MTSKLRVVFLSALVLMMAMSAFGSRADAALSATGPVDPNTHFPSWYQDANGLRLDLCLAGPPNCLAAAADLTAPDGEAFYWNAGADLTTNGGNSLLVLGTEAAFAGDGVNQESVFNRIRVRANVPQTGTYVVTQPYGQKTYNVTSVTSGFEINDTVDIGCFSTPPDNNCNDGIPPDFSAALRGDVGPWLRWNPAVAPAAPAGFIGDGATPHRVIGSPTGNNLFRIDGPNIGGAGVNSVTTDLFTIQGKISAAATQPPPGGDTQAPTVPTGPTASAPSSSQINLAWTASSDNVGVAGYKVFRDGGATAIATVTAGTAFSDSGLAPSSSHSYKVAAYDAAVNQSAQSVAASATTRATTSSPAATLSPLSVRLANTKVRNTSAARTVTLTNTGTATLNITSILVGGANASNFAISSRTCGATLAPGANCTIRVTFRPTAKGIRRGALTFTDNAPASPQIVTLQGRGI